MQWSWLAHTVARTTAIAMLAQTPAQLPAPGRTAAPPAGTAQISGIVKSAVDDKPLSRARVSAVSDALPEARVAITGSDGKYAISDLPAGSYTISVTRSGYAPQSYGQGRTITGTPIAVAATQLVSSIDLALAPGGYIAGKILDEDGTPFAGAVVDALVTRSEAGVDSLFSVSSAQTDDRGEFRLFGLAPGQYYVSAADPAFRSISTPKGVVHYSPTYYPGVAAADQARPIVIGATGEAPKVEFRLKLVPPARVSGRLIAFDARPLLNGVIIMSPMEGEGVPTEAPDPSIQPDGVFSFGQVVPGRYQIRARGQTDSLATALFAVFSIEVNGSDVQGIQLTLRPGAVLDGKLALDIQRGTRKPHLTAIRVRTPFIDGNSFGDPLTGTVQPDGKFAVRGIMKGAHQIVLDGLPPPWVVKSVVHHGTDITDLQLDVSEKEQFRDVQITITDVESELSGIVQNAHQLPVANTAVLVFPRSSPFWMRTNRRMRIAYTDQKGRFAIAGLPAGEYLAVASASIDESDLGKRDRLKALTDVATSFTMESDASRTSVTLPIVAPPSAPAVR